MKRIVEVPRWVFVMIVIDSSLSSLVFSTMLIAIFTDPGALWR